MCTRRDHRVSPFTAVFREPGCLMSARPSKVIAGVAATSSCADPARWSIGSCHSHRVTWQMLLIAAYRVGGSLPVLRWPLIGGIIYSQAGTYSIMYCAMAVPVVLSAFVLKFTWKRYESNKLLAEAEYPAGNG